MAQFEILTRHIPEIEKGNFSKVIPPYKRFDEKLNDMITISGYIEFSSEVKSLEADLYTFGKANQEFRYKEYGEVLEENGIKTYKVDVSNLNGKVVFALLFAIFRAQRFSDDALLEALSCGTVLRCLNRLKEIDDSTK